ncbi:tryptophan halogenase family protein [Novosphingobium capsulatum]|uniref:tryptophan halogenase family protein n=1 Tax=Novosphingobium capsulatum TaxID=13688 RepID=UPI0007898CD7|nr:tryptophan halogenase family protein [Novosphingobium capsulatum]WQD95036.1 tryptophan halogenase family protein [Novosphingobium capsulatum]
MNEAAIRSITILGGGTAGWMAATLLAKAFDGQPLRITLVESEEIGIIGVGEATVPLFRLFNDRLGLDEHAFLQATMGAYKLGIEFCDWGQVGNTHFHGFGDYGEPIGGIAPHHHWLRLARSGEAAPIDDYSAPYALAQRGKFTPADPRQPRYSHAYHFDAVLYARYLRNLAESWGVTRVEGRVVDVPLDPQTGHIRALHLADGQVVDGEFFVDCTGFAAELIGKRLGTAYVDWSHWLPCDSAIAVPSARHDPPAPFTRSTALAAGWQWRIPLQHREGNGIVYASAYMSDAAAEDALLGSLGGAPLANPRRFRFTAGRREAFWQRNCVALGFASGFLEPLESTGIQLIQNGIGRLIEFFPDRHFDPRVAAEYNRVCQVEWDRIRDFIIAHYCVSQRPEPFWQAARAMDLPDTLQQKLDSWYATGKIPLLDGESYQEPSWAAILLGNGVLPQRHDPLIDALPIDMLRAHMARRREDLARMGRSAPDHRFYLARHCQAAA